MRQDNYYTDYEDTSFEEEAPAALATPSDDQILAFVQANIGNPALIAETAAQYGVSVADLSRVTGYDSNAVVSYFEQADVAPPAYEPPPVIVEPPSTGIVETNASVDTVAQDYWNQQAALQQAEWERQAAVQQAEWERQAAARDAVTTTTGDLPTTTATTSDTSNVGNVLAGNILAGASWNSTNNTLGDQLTAATGQQTLNTAVDGATTADTLNQLNTFIDGGGSFAPGSTVFLQTGGVDMLQGIDDATITNNINQIVSTLDAQGVNVVLTASPRAGSVNDVVNNNFESDSASFYSDIAANNSNVAVVDSMGNILKDKSLLRDALHTNAAGEQVYNQSVIDAYNRLINKGVDSNTALEIAVEQEGTTTTATTADTTPVGALTTIQNNTATEDIPKSGLATVSAVADKAASTTPVGGLTQAAPVNALDNVTQQILGQNLTSKWKGEGKGSAEKNAADMAGILTSIGITDIKDFGMVTKTVDAAVIPQYERTVVGYDQEGNQIVDSKIIGYVDQEGKPVDSSLVKTEFVPGDENGMGGGTAYIAPVGKQEVFGNKKTGQEVPVTYGERQQGDAFGGTFDGDGNTGYRVKFAPDGTPIFYTTQASSNDLQILMDDLGPLGQIALAFATGGLSIPEQIAAKFAMSVLSGQDIGDAIKSAATSYVGSLVPGLDFIQDGASYLNNLDSTGILSKAFTGAAVGGTKAVLSGQDLGDAVLAGAASGGASGAATALLGNIEGFDDLSKTQQTTIRNLVTGTLTGKPITTTLLNSVIDTATSEVGKAIDSTVTGLTDDNTLDSSTIDKVTSTLNVDGTDGTDDDDEDDDGDGDDDGDDVVTTTTTGGTGKSSLGNNATVGAVTSVLKSTLANTAKTATKGAIKSAVTGKKMAARPSVAKQLTGSALSAVRRAVPTKVDISKLKPTTTTKKAPPKKIDVAQLKAMRPVSGLSAIKKG